MRRPRNQWLMARQIAVHAFLGAMLGIVFTFVLFLMPGAKGVSAISAGAPVQTTLMILLMVTSNFAVGAGLTGFVFLSMENEDRDRGLY
jgi:hypothetical protein